MSDARPVTQLFDQSPPSSVRFTVPGRAVPQGSSRAFIRGGKAVVTHDNPKTMPWRGAVALTAREALNGRFAADGAVGVMLAIHLDRPKSHWRRDGTPKASAPARPTGRPDLDKLVRAVLDALTGVAFRDDAQVTTIVATLDYVAAPAIPPSVHVTIDAQWISTTQEDAA